MMMKTSNKLLLGMYLFIILLLFSSFIVIKLREKNVNYQKYENQKIVLDYKFDSLYINATSTAKVHISKGDSLAIKYKYNGNNPKFTLIGKSLHIDSDASFKIELTDTLDYLSVFADKCYFHDIEQDSIEIVGIQVRKFYIQRSSLNKVKLEGQGTKYRIYKCNFNNLELDLIDDSKFKIYSPSKINNFSGSADSTSQINISGIKNIKLTTE